MSEPIASRLTVGDGPEARDISVLSRPGATPGLFWLGGFRSDMAGTKARALDDMAMERGLACTRFDYSGHGESGGRFEDGTISRWLAEAQTVFDITRGSQIVVGSSMGGWLGLLLADAHRQAAGPDAGRIAGLILIAPAVDMTETLMWDRFDETARRQLTEDGVLQVPSDYSDMPYPVTSGLIEDGRAHLFGDGLIETGCPVHILQGVADTDVPWQGSVALVSRFASDDVVLTLIKDGDHRLSRPEDLERLKAAIDGTIAEMPAP
jgi:pimeloyl-ACP methyl ester carboxylesterase